VWTPALPPDRDRFDVSLIILGFLGGLADYIDDLFNWPPKAQSDQGELIWVFATLALSMGLMVLFGRWWQR
jgi:uncharacterized membrane-anchored protein